MLKIGTVINYCTLDYRFIRFCINAVVPFSSQIVLVAADHFFDGTPENRELLNKTYEEARNIDIVEYAWQESNPIFSHNMSRWNGLQKLRDDTEFVLFLDADEIVDRKFLECLLGFEDLLLKYDAFLCKCYWYFREAR
jgi:cellulose synthase/poly-beta-1,6-N-acetylglucosamine synthase-like glycosyltransferase